MNSTFKFYKTKTNFNCKQVLKISKAEDIFSSNIKHFWDQADKKSCKMCFTYL